MADDHRTASRPPTPAPHPDATPAQCTTAEKRATALRAAAHAKQDAAIARAEAGLRTMIKAGDRIGFRALARVAGVSVNFLYSNRELKERIESLRDQQAHPVGRPPSHGPTGDNAVIRTLTAKLSLERREHAQQVRLLREQLAAAHGELLLLRRSATRLGDHADDRES